MAAASNDIRPTTSLIRIRNFTEQSGSVFLNLPGELRNKIYDFVLPESDNVLVSNTGYTRPALLSTCKQIAVEATAIWYSKNTFDFWITNFDSRAVSKFSKGFLMSLHPAHTITYSVDLSAPSWKNLLIWLRAYYEGAIQTPIGLGPFVEGVVSQPTRIMCAILAAMFDTARCFAEKGHPWELMEEFVMMQRGSLIETDKRWADE